MTNVSVLLLAVLIFLCLGAAVVAVAAALYLWVRRGVQDINRDWGNLGIATGLTLKPGGAFSQPELIGEYRQRPIHIYTYSSGTQESRTTYTAVALMINSPPGGALEISPAAGLAAFFGKMVNAQDVEVGDPAFDSRFVVKSNPPDFAPKMLDDERLQAKIMELPGLFRIGIEGSNLVYAKGGLEDDANLLIRVFNVLSELADSLERR